MTVLDDFLALPRFTKAIPGWGVSAAVARGEGFAQAHDAVKHHAEITGSMNLNRNVPADVTDTLLGLAEECNSGEGVDLCLNASPYREVRTDVLELGPDGVPREIDAEAWGPDQLTAIQAIEAWCSVTAAKVAATMRIIGDGPIYGPLAVAWVWLDTEVFWRHRRDMTPRTPAEQASYERAIRLKLDVVGAIVRKWFPDAKLGWFRNGETAFYPGGGNMIGNCLADADCRQVEWYSPHSRVNTRDRFQWNRRGLPKRSPGNDSWGVAIALGSGYDRVGQWTWSYDDGRSAMYHLGRHLAATDDISWAYEYPGPFDQRTGTTSYAQAMVAFSRGWHDRE